MLEEKVFFDGEFGKICGVLHKTQTSDEISIIIHGFSSSKDSSSLISANICTEENIDALRIDLDNQGESDLDFRTGTTIPNYIKQVQTSIDYVKELGYKHINLIGTSHGGLIAFHAARNNVINKLILRATRVDYRENKERQLSETELQTILERGFFIKNKRDGTSIPYTTEIYTTAKEYSMYDYASTLNTPTYFIQGTDDTDCPLKYTKKVLPMFPNAKLFLIEGAGHNLGVNGDWSESQEILRAILKE